MIDYCKKLKPKQKEENLATEEKKDIAKVLKSDEYKKEKVTVMASKRSADLDLFSVAGKQKKQKNTEKKVVVVEEGVEQKEIMISLNHKIEVLGYFEKLRVGVPMFENKLDATLKLLEEKKVYFASQTEQAKPEEKSEGAANQERKGNQAGKGKKGGHTANFQAHAEEFPSI